MNPFLTNTFLGTTSQRIESEQFKISVVHYTQQVSEEWHFHERVHISSILRGGNLESRRSEEVQVLPGKVMMYQQGEIHRNRFTVHPSTNLNIELEEAFFTDDLRLSKLHLDESSNIELLRLFLELVLNDEHSIESSRQLLQGLFWTDHSVQQREWISKVKTILNDRWNEFVPLRELANETQIHPITISKYFSKYQGMTLSDYMRKIKVKRAIELILNSSRSLADIAFSCGFSDQSHMVRLVRRYTGYTPGMIRTLTVG